MNWYDLENASPKHLPDFIAYASFAGVEGVFHILGKEDDLQGQGVSTPAYDVRHSSENVSNSLTLPTPRMVFVREGIQWMNSLPIDVEVDLEYVQLGFVENRGMERKMEEQASVLRFDGPFRKGEHPLVLSLTQRVPLLVLTLHAAGSGERTVRVFDLLGVDPDSGGDAR